MSARRALRDAQAATAATQKAEHALLLTDAQVLAAQEDMLRRRDRARRR